MFTAKNKQNKNKEQIQLTNEEIYLLINWYQQLQNVNPDFVGREDDKVYRKLFAMLGA